jgi:hypothetical protein
MRRAHTHTHTHIGGKEREWRVERGGEANQYVCLITDKKCPLPNLILGETLSHAVCTGRKPKINDKVLLKIIDRYFNRKC